MLCEKCKREEASIHLTEIIKDVKSEVHLCEKCARSIGLNSKISNFSISVPEMLSFLDVSEVDETRDLITCETCGLSFMDYNKDGKLGCPDCYKYLEDSLETVIISYHGEKKHIGKFPDNPGTSNKHIVVKSVKKEKNSLDDLKSELSDAVHDERFEDAAVLRDEIKKRSRK